ncbi:hypothetical protein SAMN04488073_3234 [Marinobacter gudaonensis]|uniref:DUF2147 domain-containing protein n=1 Tax=Marinobacter gudaonensis TaxID=375760 RepID=A0A1I6HZI2_9GAMM|nr:DUF2147 domain-containing protein [Marinobacter gudaonensis]SFR59861.1 hypothetical protein SAMN04488073_3234 [Marinobacter gudaonensis]
MKYFILILCVFSSLAQARESVFGVWEVVDEDTEQVKSVILITGTDQQIKGEVIQLYHPELPDELPRCGACNGALENDPIVGMTILRGSVKPADSDRGDIILLDPATGKTHEVNLVLEDDGLRLRLDSTAPDGYSGSPVLGKTAVWQRPVASRDKS